MEVEMPLRSARLTGDPVLDNCLAGRHRMLAGEDNLSVKRLQAALIDLGRPVGPTGADGVFGPNTGTAVAAYKTAKGLVPSDPVVGPGTTAALDADLLVEPPILDPTFGEFSPFVVDHRLEQFVALELSALLRVPLDSWRHMLGRFALTALNSGQLLGIVAQQRAFQLRDRFLAVADPVQQSGLPAPLQGIAVHELTHARNLVNIASLLAITDTDATAYADVPLAVIRSGSGTPTANTLRSYVAEVTARHVHWVVLQELAGTPGEIKSDWRQHHSGLGATSSGISILVRPAASACCSTCASQDGFTHDAILMRRCGSVSTVRRGR
jgi:hypothetical protein